jgi:transcription initiation factor TFIIA large subunit
MNTPPMNQAQPQPGLTMPQMNNQMTNGGHPNGQRIKAEPEDQPQYQPNPGLTLPQGVNTAQARAAAHLQNNYGSRAAASINAIQGSVGSQGQPGMQPGQQQGPPNPQIAQQMQAMHQQQYQQIQAQRAAQAQAAGGIQQPGMQQPPRPQMTQEQYRQLMAEQAARQRQHLQQGQGQPQNGLPKAQTDGAGDEVETLGVVRGLDASGEEVMGRVEIDGMIRRKIEAMGQSMEGGGLMLPLHKASTSSKRQRKVKRTIAANGMPQTDGPDDDDDNKNGVKDEDLDEDAINSDLDDPDDGLNEEEDDDEALNHIMLCMYDKVQRVKNKWYVLSLFHIFPLYFPPICAGESGC